LEDNIGMDIKAINSMNVWIGLDLIGLLNITSNDRLS
jgi:hypothetical protein